MRKYWICAVLLAFVFGIAIDRVVQRRTLSLARDSALAGIEKLHQLDVRVTLQRDAKALQEVWTDDAVRLAPGTPADVGKRPSMPQMCAASWPTHPDSPSPVTRPTFGTSVWSMPTGPSSGESPRRLIGHPPTSRSSRFMERSLRILHRESNGDWKF